jgi:hypothetical protein
MTIPSNVVIGQGMLVYRKQPDGSQPIVMQTRCNCSSTPREQTSRFVDQHREGFITHEQFTKGEWQ